jgi:nicotinamide phosphoribosyltransferase
MRRNIIVKTDSYKLAHWQQYPPGTKFILSYLESRGGMFDETVFFGLQYYLKEYLQGQVFTYNDITHAANLANMHFVDQPNLFNAAGWERLLVKHSGRLPLRIKAIPEGTPVGIHNVLMTIENTDPEFPWLTNVFETLLLKVWYPISVATLSREIKKHILQNLIDTGDPSTVDFKLQEFGYRGNTSEESAGIGGSAHLVNFKGTDTLAALEFVREYYSTHQSYWKEPDIMPGFSVPASEHSTMTTWGPKGEVAAVENMLKAYPTGIVSIVGDSYDIYNFCQEVIGGAVREQILNRNGKVVVRPDSGDPKSVVLACLNILGERFGYETNSKGYKVLNPKVGIIRGDGMNYHTCRDLFNHLKANGWSGDNLVIGMGGKLIQSVDRDTQKFAIKCSYAVIGETSMDVFKKPITDSGKDSKRGQLVLLRDSNGNYTTLTKRKDLEYTGDALVTVFEDGVLYNQVTFNQVRENARIEMAAQSAA